MPPVSLGGWVRAPAQTPMSVIKINGTIITNPISIDVNLGVDQQSSSASVRLAADDYPAWVGRILEVRLGYGGVNGGTVLVFVGEIEDIDTQYLPYSVELKASGYLKRAQRNAGNTDPLDGAEDPVKEWSGATDSQIWSDLMKLANVPSYNSGSGDSRTIAGPIKLMPGDNIRSKIDELDHASESGQRTFEFAGQVYRTAALRIPGGVPTWSYVEGEASETAVPPTWPLYSLQRQQTDRDVKNQVIVTGVQSAGTTSTAVVGAVRQEFSQFWGPDGNGHPIYVPFSFQSDFLETREQCDAVAQRYMYEHNKLTDIVQMRTPLNPFAQPSRTVGITSDRLGLRTATNYWVRQIHHHWGDDGASTDWTLEGGAGATGYLVGLPPVPLFEQKVTKESYQQGVYSTPTPVYTVACDASASYDPDGTDLSYSWSTSAGGSGTGVTFTTTFTGAQWNDTTSPPTITLTVTDSDVPDAHSAVNEQPAGDTGANAGEAKVIAMYVAALGAAYATPDSWETTNTWTPPATCLSVGRIGAQGTNYFGLSNGGVYQTSDYLATAPTLKWTAPASVTAIWMSEIDTNIVAIGLSNGDFWLTKDSFATTPALKRNFVNAINWINGSIENKAQWRACVGQDVWITNHDWELGDYHVLVSFAGEVIRQTELGPFANYASASGSAGEPVLKREGDGFTYDFPSLSPEPSEAHMTNFIDRDSLLVGDDQGRSFLGTSNASTTLVQKTSIGYGAVRDMLRDNTNFAAAYAACNMALAKTYDTAESWVRVLTFNGTTIQGLRLGYDSAPLTPPVELTGELVERVMVPYDRTVHDTPTDNGTVLTMDLWNHMIPCDPPPAPCVRNDGPPANWYLRSYTPTDYVGSFGLVHSWREGEAGYVNVPVGGATQYFDRSYSGWVLSPYTGTGIPSGWTDSAGGHGEQAAWIGRHTFTLPAMTIGRALLLVLGNYTLVGPMHLPVPVGQVGSLYINDTLIVSPVPTVGGYIAYIDSSILVADGVTENLIAIYCTNVYKSSSPRIAYKLAVGAASGAASESVALFESSTGRLRWGSTNEATSEVYPSIPAGWYDPVVGTITPGGALGGAADFHMGSYAYPPWPSLDHGFKLGNKCGSYVEGMYHVIKQAADFPAGADTAWHLVLRKHRYNDVIIDDIYINGTRLSTGTPASPAGDTGNNMDIPPLTSARIYRFDVPSGMMVMGGRNTIAFLCRLAGSANPVYWGLSWYMEQQT